MLRSGFGLSGVVLSTQVYTAILLIGLIGSTFPEPLIHRASTPLDVRGVLISSRESRNPESSSIQESTTNFVVIFHQVAPTPIQVQVSII